MKKIIFAVCFLFMLQPFVSADEIIDAAGNVTPCKIITVAGGLIEYEKNGNKYSFARQEDSLIFNDYVDVKTDLFKKEAVTRYSGKIIVKDLENVRIRNEDGDMDIPWYRVKFVGIYRP